MSYVAEIDYIPSQNTGEVNSKKSRQISVGVYWYPGTKKRFTLEVRKEQDKQIQKGGVPTISNGGVCEKFIK
jgi:hypothetical protein